MASSWAANRGEYSASMARNSGVEVLEARLKKYIRRTPQHGARSFHRDDRVLEGRRLRIGGDGGDLGPLLGHPGVERRADVTGSDQLERWQRERPGRGFQQRVHVGAAIGEGRLRPDVRGVTGCGCGSGGGRAGRHRTPVSGSVDGSGRCPRPCQSITAEDTHRAGRPDGADQLGGTAACRPNSPRPRWIGRGRTTRVHPRPSTGGAVDRIREETVTGSLAQSPPRDITGRRPTRIASCRTRLA